MEQVKVVAIGMPERRQLKTVFTVDEHVSKTIRNVVFVAIGDNLQPITLFLTIFDPRLSTTFTFSLVGYPV